MFLRSPPIELVDINEWISLINTSITSQISSLLPSSLVGTFKFYSHSDFQLYVLCVQLLSNIWLFCGPWTLNPPASVHGIFQSRILEWVAISFSRGSCLTQGWNPRLLHCRQILNSLSHLVLISFHWWVILEKTLMLGKIEGKRRRGQQRMRWLGGITVLTDLNLSKLYEIVKDRRAWRAAGGYKGSDMT